MSFNAKFTPQSKHRRSSLEINFQGTWDKLETKICSQRQPWTEYMRHTLAHWGKS